MSSCDSDHDESPGRDRGGRRRRKMTKVNMPSGDSVLVTVPARPCDHQVCDFKCDKIALKKEGKMGRREREIIEKQMNSTIVPHALQENGGGKFSSYKVVAVHKIQNRCLWKKFRERQNDLAKDAGYCNQKMLFHGTSVAENIIGRGFDTGKANPNGMFGKSIYFAEHSSKSNQYAYGLLGGNGCPQHRNKNCYECTRTILLCRVTLGKMYKQQNANKLERPPAGYHSVKGEPTDGGALRYPEYAVYDNDQVYPEYLITYKIVQ